MTNDLVAPTKTLRPSRELYKKAVRRDLWIALPLLVLVTGSQIGLQLARASIRGDEGVPGMVWFYAALLIAGLAFSFIYYFALMRNLRIVVEATGLTVVNGAGRVREIAYSEVGTVIQTLIRFPARTLPMLFLLDHTGRRIHTMYGTVWPTEALLEVGAAIRVTPTSFAEPVTYRELRTRYPAAFSWARANPVLLTALIAAGVIVALVVFVVVLFAVTF
jgi:hypothetical protein